MWVNIEMWEIYYDEQTQMIDYPSYANPQKSQNPNDFN